MDFGWKEDNSKRQQLSLRASSLFFSQSCLFFHTFLVLIVTEGFIVQRKLLFYSLVFTFWLEDAFRSISTYHELNNIFSQYFLSFFHAVFKQ